MAKQTGIFVDLSSLYYCVTKKYGRRKVSYKNLLEYVKGLGGEVKTAIAYGTQNNNEAEIFIKRIKELGFATKYKAPRAVGGKNWYRGNWTTGMIADMMAEIPNLDRYVICSSEFGLIDLCEYLMSQKKEVVILACDIADELKKKIPSCVEIPESMLEGIREKQPIVPGQPEALRTVLPPIIPDPKVQPKVEGQPELKI